MIFEFEVEAQSVGEKTITVVVRDKVGDHFTFPIALTDYNKVTTRPGRKCYMDVRVYTHRKVAAAKRNQEEETDAPE